MIVNSYGLNRNLLLYIGGNSLYAGLSLFLAADKNHSVKVAGIIVYMGNNLRKGADKVSVLIIAGICIVLVSKIIGHSADKISVCIIAALGMSMCACRALKSLFKS